MGGSRKWFVYTTDLGDDFAIEADESNVESYAAGTQDYSTATAAIVYGVPRNIKPRHAVFGDGVTGSTIKIPIITQALYNSINGATTMTDPLDPGKTLPLLYKRPEEIRLPKGIDTGKTDGDAT